MPTVPAVFETTIFGRLSIALRPFVNASEYFWIENSLSAFVDRKHNDLVR